MDKEKYYERLNIATHILASAMKTAIHLHSAPLDVVKNAVATADLLMKEAASYSSEEKTVGVETKVEQVADQRILSATISSHNVLGIQVRHNGQKYGPDEKGGSFVEIMLEDHACTNMQVNGEESRLVYLRFGGGAERETLLEALKIIVKELEENEKI